MLAQPWEDERIENKSSSSDFENHMSVRLENIAPAMEHADSICVQEACIRPSPDSSFSLQSISFKTKPGTLNIIVGPVGSGKSTLLKAILGELKCEQGTIRVNSTKMAYCSQTTWLPNATIRQIVCGGLELDIDQSWYDTVIHACALNEDILQLERGHDTLIGSRGVTLSRGQKQRLVKQFHHHEFLVRTYTDLILGIGQGCIRQTGYCSP